MCPFLVKLMKMQYASPCTFAYTPTTKDKNVYRPLSFVASISVILSLNPKIEAPCGRKIISFASFEVTDMC